MGICCGSGAGGPSMGVVWPIVRNEIAGVRAEGFGVTSNEAKDVGI